MMVVIIVCGLGCWPASCVVAAETSSLHLRAKAQGLGWFTTAAAAAVMGFVLPYIFNPDKGNLGVKTGFIYGGLSLVAAFISWLIIPEMKGRSYDDLDIIFHQNVASRAFETYTIRA